MKKFFALIAAFFLLSCDVSSDEYTFERNSKLLDPRREIVVVLHISPQDVKESYSNSKNARKLEQGEELQAYTTINDKTCTIHIVDPKYKYDPAFAGHELIHCLYGNFHPSQDGTRGGS